MNVLILVKLIEDSDHVRLQLTKLYVIFINNEYVACVSSELKNIQMYSEPYIDNPTYGLR